MNVYKIPVRGYFEVNSYFLIDEDTGHGFLIDPGAQGNEIARIIQSKVWTIEKILLTHGGGFHWETPDHFRIVYLPAIDVLSEAMEAMGEFLMTYKQRG